MDCIKSQAEYQRIFYKDLEVLTDNEKVELTRIFCLGLLEEVNELLLTINGYPWKKEKQIDLSMAQEELVDQFHFFMNLCLIWGINSFSLLKTKYYKKLNKNYLRGEKHNEQSHNH